MELGSRFGERSRAESRGRGLVPWLCVFGTLGLLGCNVFDPSLVEGEVDLGEPTDLSTPEVDMRSLDGLRKVPSRPSGEDGGSIEPVLFALRDVMLNQDGDRWREIGLDLDDLDTQLPDVEVECVPPDDSDFSDSPLASAPFSSPSAGCSRYSSLSSSASDCASLRASMAIWARRAAS